MRKKVMVAEKSDAIRSIAETILHQNGYDVLTASTIEKAKELIIGGLPNMVIIGADLKDSEGNYLYDSLDENEVTSTIPLLIIADPDGRTLPYPDEVILPRPFNPSEFIERVRLFIGGGLDDSPLEQQASDDAFPVDSVDDEFLDSALGVDNIEVEESEVLNQTTSVSDIKKSRRASKSKDVFDTFQPDDENGEESKSETVESLLISDDDSGKVLTDQKKPEESPTFSKLEISSDQYGLTDKKPKPIKKPDESEPDEGHDYDWFIDEMKREGGKPKVPKAKKQSDTNDSGLVKTSTSDAIEPINIPGSKSETAATDDPKAGAKITPGGVDKFISDFKHEAERISADKDSSRKSTPASGRTKRETISTQAVTKHVEKTDTGPSDRQIDEEVRHFCNNLVEIVSEKLAKKIVGKIDKDEIYKIIQKDLKDLISGSK
jgi:hypothetical protein